MSPARIWALMAKEGHELARDSVTLALCGLMPLVMLFLFGYAVNLDVEYVALGVLDQDGTPASRQLVDRFTAGGYFILVERFSGNAEVDAALQHGRVRTAIVVPHGFGRRLVREESAPVQVLVDGTHAATAALAANYAAAIVRAFPVVRPPGIEVQIRVWYNPSMRSVNYIVPGLFSVILMAFPPLLTALAIVREKETGTIQQIFASPVTSAEFVAGKLVPYALVAFAQMTVVIAIAYFWFEVPFRGSVGLLLGTSVIYVLTTVAIGLFVSVVTRTQLAAMLLALVVTLMPSFLFSGFLFPVFTMPVALQLYSRLFPASYFMEISRGIVLKGAEIGSLWANVGLLLSYTVLVFGFAAWRIRQKVA